MGYVDGCAHRQISLIAALASSICVIVAFGGISAAQTSAIDPWLSGALHRLGCKPVSTHYRTLKYGMEYELFGSTFNSTNGRIGINKVDVKYEERVDPNGSPAWPNFGWQKAFADKKFILAPGESQETVTALDKYPVKLRPETFSADRQNAELVVKYAFTYFIEEGGKWSAAKSDGAMDSCAVYRVVP